MAEEPFQQEISTHETLGEGPTFEARYRNYRGDIGRRKLAQTEPIAQYESDWHPGNQPILKARDVERDLTREFALYDFIRPGEAKIKEEELRDLLMLARKSSDITPDQQLMIHRLNATYFPVVPEDLPIFHDVKLLSAGTYGTAGKYPIHVPEEVLTRFMVRSDLRDYIEFGIGDATIFPGQWDNPRAASVCITRLCARISDIRPVTKDGESALYASIVPVGPFRKEFTELMSADKENCLFVPRLMVGTQKKDSLPVAENVLSFDFFYLKKIDTVGEPS